MPSQPNLLLVLTDQQRFDTVAALGNPEIHTPNLDRLVREGVSFTHAFSPAPVCVPARACLHYGKYPGRTRCFANAHPMPTQQPSYVDRLSEAGYETIAIGKCHFTPDRQAMRGFGRRIRQEEVPASIADDDYLTFLQRSPYRGTRDVHGAWGELVYMPQVSPLPAEYHPTQWVGDQAVEFIKSKACDGEAGGSQPDRRESPWFAFVSFIHPHPPYAPPAGWDDLYDVDSLSLPYQPKGYEQRQNVVIQRALHNYYFDPPTGDSLWRLVKARYYACISFVDHQVGCILDALEATGQLANTMIVFTSDHGEMLGDLGLIGKEDMYSPSVRVPMLMRRPDRAGAGTRVTVPTSLVDIGRTMLTAAGVEAPFDSDGHNLSCIADHPERFADRVVLAQVQQHERGIYLAADRQHKYTFSAADNRETLFEYASDPQEQDDLIGSQDAAAVTQRLKSKVVSYLHHTGQHESLAEGGHDFNRYPGYRPAFKPRKPSNTPCPWSQGLVNLQQASEEAAAAESLSATR